MNIRKLAALATAGLVALQGAAMADSIYFDGTVTGKESVPVYATIGGTVETVALTAGETVTADDVLLSLKTTKVYAEEAGTVTGIFGEAGDSAETVASRYGAVMYIEEDTLYTVSASVSAAYNDTDTKFVHVGEKVYLVVKNKTTRTGEGTISAVDGINYTIQVTSGEFIAGETVLVYRDEDHTSTLKIGSGTIARKNPTAVTGSGSIVSINVQDGDTVSRGDVLFETLTGTFDGYYMSGKDMYVGTDGVISQISVSAGSQVQKDGIIAYVYPEGAMRVEGSIGEGDLNELNVGDKVTLEFNHTETTFPGTITMISAVGSTEAGGSEATYTVYIDFTPDETIRYGMSALIATVEETEEVPEEAEEDTADETAEEAADETAEQGEMPEMPADGEMPSFGDGTEMPDMSSMPEGFQGGERPERSGDTTAENNEVSE